MHEYFRYLVLLLSIALWSCMDHEPQVEELFDLSHVAPGQGLFIVNEGNFMHGTATLSFYDAEARRVENEVFSRANSMRLGDVAQSMTIHNGKGYIAVNNSGIVFIIDIDTLRVTGFIRGLVSPRYVHIVSDSKAYITDLYSPYITVFDPSTLEKTDTINTGGHKSTEQMVRYGRYVYTNCWSFDNTILMIDTLSDSIVKEIEVGLQPTSLVMDRNGKLWTITDGGHRNGQYGGEPSALYRIGAATGTVEQKFEFAVGDSGSELCINAEGDKIYFINGSVWRMDVADEQLPDEPFIGLPVDRQAIFYGLAVNPANSEIYVADAIDYQQPGVIYRYSAEGRLVDTFKVGVTPGAFCFR